MSESSSNKLDHEQTYVLDDQFYLPVKPVLNKFWVKDHITKNNFKYIYKLQY